MYKHALIRWAGFSAIAGGTLRSVTAPLSATQIPAVHLVYLTIDLLLLLAVVGLYSYQRKRIGTGERLARWWRC